MTSTPPQPDRNRTTQWVNFLIWILIALFLRWQVIEPRWIPSGSMLPTLQLQDRILVEKITPKLNQAIHTHLKVESIVVFHPPQALIQQGYERKSDLIKRVIGLPGDEIEINKGHLIRNGKIIKENWIASPMDYYVDKFTVPNDYVWVLGDNRNNSLDSHIWGALPVKNIIGTAVLRYWPLNKFGLIRFPTHTKVETSDLSAIRSVS